MVLFAPINKQWASGRFCFKASEEEDKKIFFIKTKKTLKN